MARYAWEGHISQKLGSRKPMPGTRRITATSSALHSYVRGSKGLHLWIANPLQGHAISAFSADRVGH